MMTMNDNMGNAQGTAMPALGFAADEALAVFLALAAGESRLQMAVHAVAGKDDEDKDDEEEDGDDEEEDEDEEDDDDDDDDDDEEDGDEDEGDDDDDDEKEDKGKTGA